MHRFKDLEIWKYSREFCKEIYEVTQAFPETEKFGLVMQLRRGCVSIPSNIAEGASRKSNKDFDRFLEIALGSCFEVETQLLISNDLDVIDDFDLKKLQSKISSIIKMISKFRSNITQSGNCNNPII
ncbi:four helix bundle protein [Gramella sp. BOM4]|nr:four helix bundle protein [Christiangramia bathymodioli]